MTTNYTKTYPSLLNKLVDQHNNTCHHSVNKKPINREYLALTEKIEKNCKAPGLKLMIE